MAEFGSQFYNLSSGCKYVLRDKVSWSACALDSISWLICRHRTLCLHIQLLANYDNIIFYDE